MAAKAKTKKSSKVKRVENTEVEETNTVDKPQKTSACSFVKRW